MYPLKSTFFKKDRFVAEPQLPPLPDANTFSSELIKARSEYGMTQAQLAEKSGLSISAIKAYESGRNMPGARELRELSQSLQASPNKLLFGTELPFKQRSTLNLLADAESEDENVTRVRGTMLLALLSHDEQHAIFTLAQSIAIARHGVSKVNESLLAADFMVGTFRGVIGQTSDAKIASKPIDPEKFAADLDKFLEKKGHKPATKKSP